MKSEMEDGPAGAARLGAIGMKTAVKQLAVRAFRAESTGSPTRAPASNRMRPMRGRKCDMRRQPKSPAAGTAPA
jgi:hypothetical protein